MSAVGREGHCVPPADLRMLCIKPSEPGGSARCSLSTMNDGVMTEIRERGTFRVIVSPSWRDGRSVPRRLHRSRHEHPPLIRQIFPVGASSNQADTIAHAHCADYRAFLHRPTATIRILPLRDCRSRCGGCRARFRHQASRAHCLRSNSHSSSLLLTPSVRLRGFLPWGLPDVCPHTSLGMARSASTGRHRATLNTLRHSTDKYARPKAVVRLTDMRGAKGKRPTHGCARGPSP